MEARQKASDEAMEARVRDLVSSMMANLPTGDVPKSPLSAKVNQEWAEQFKPIKLDQALKHRNGRFSIIDDTKSRTRSSIASTSALCRASSSAILASCWAIRSAIWRFICIGSA
ncbi:hypothetical protein LguiA_034219 [Lonicera macranthoides]